MNVSKIVSVAPQAMQAIRRNSPKLQQQFSQLANNALKFYGGSLQNGSIGRMPGHVAQKIGQQAAFFDPKGTDNLGLRQLFDQFRPKKIPFKFDSDGFPDMSDSATSTGVGIANAIQMMLDDPDTHHISLSDLTPRKPYSDPWRQY